MKVSNGFTRYEFDKDRQIKALEKVVEKTLKILINEVAQ